MRASKRSSAIKARTAVQQFTSKEAFEIKEPKKDNSSKIDEEADFFQEPSSEEESDLMSIGESNLSESSIEPDDPNQSQDLIFTNPKGKRSKKNSNKKQYVKLTEFETFGPGPNSLSTWRHAIENARPMKRGRKSKKGIERHQRPPTDILFVKEGLSVNQLPHCFHRTIENDKFKSSTVVSNAVDKTVVSSLFIQGEEYGINQEKSVKNERGDVSICRSGDGAVTGISWCRCCCEFLATSNYPTENFSDRFSDTSKVKSAIIIWKLDGKTMTLERKAELRHSLGVVRKLEWYPFRNKDSSFLAVAFSTGSTFVFYIPLPKVDGVLDLEKFSKFEFKEASTFSWTPFYDKIIIGSPAGLVSLCSLSGECPEKIFKVKVCEKRVFSISFCPSNPNFVAIGSYDQSIYVLNMTSPYDLQNPFSLLNPIPNVRWLEEGILFWDTDQTIRLISYSPPLPCKQKIVLKFSCSLMDLAVSPVHNVLAASGSDGSIHFAILQDCTEGYFSIEKTVLHYRMNNEGEIHVDLKVADAVTKPQYTIHDLKNSIVCLAWCPSSKAPGVLTFGTGSGLIGLVSGAKWFMLRGLTREVKKHKLILLFLVLIFIMVMKQQMKSKSYNVTPYTQENYKKQYLESVSDFLGFWREKAQEYITWSKLFTNVYSGDFNQGINTWFNDGLLNVAYNCVDRHALITPQKVALIWEGDEISLHREVTYVKLLEESSKFANYLKSQGVRKGDTVTIYMPMVPEAVFAMLGCARIGATHNVVFAGFSAESLSDRIVDSNSKILITADEGKRGGKTINLKLIADKAVQLSGALIKRALVFKRTGNEVPFHPDRDHWWHEHVPHQSEQCDIELVDSEHPLFMIYTSGSTGKPKGVVHSSAGYLLYAAITQKTVFDYQDGDIFGCLADIGWITGHSYIVYGPLCNGATTVLFESTPMYPNPSRYWDTVQRLKINQLYTAPTVIRALRKLGEDPLKGYDLSSLKVLGTVGEPISPDAWSWYYEHVGKSSCSVVDTYWQTETGGHVVTPIASLTVPKPGSATFPFFGIVTDIVDPMTGKVLTENDVEGVLVISKPWPGIARTIKGDHQKFFDVYFKPYPGHYFTGDRAYRDQDGYIWIRGRVDDVINVSGHRLSTAEIESALGCHHACAEAAVLGGPDEITGQAVWAFVIPKEGASMDHHKLEHEFKDMVKRKIGSFAVPKKVIIINDLPKTRSGKIMRRIIRKILEGANDKKDLGDLSTINNPEIIDRLLDLITFN